MKFLHWLTARFYCLILDHCKGSCVEANPLTGQAYRVEVCRRCGKEWVRL